MDQSNPPVTTDDDEDTGEDDREDMTDLRPPEDGFRYMRLNEDSDFFSEQREDKECNANDVKVKNGFSSSGCESSDIEVIQESSDSIEVLASCEQLDNDPWEVLRDNNQDLKPEGVAIEKPFANVLASAPSSGPDSQSTSDTATIKSSSSNSCSNIAMEEDPDEKGTSFGEQQQPKNNLEAEAREIFAAIDALDRDSSKSTPDEYSSPEGETQPGFPSESGFLYDQDNYSGRPDSLSLPRPLQFYEKRRLIKKDSSASSLSEFSSRSSSMDALIEAATSTPLTQQGTVTTEGEMMAFVASGLDHMIRMSSPLSRKDSSGAGSFYSGNLTPRSVTSLSSSASGWSTSSASGWSYSGLSRSPSVVTQSPDDIPPVDPRALMDLEVSARHVATSLNQMMATLKTNLFKMSSLTYDCLGAYQEGIDGTCDSVDNSIKSMYALMAKCEELSAKMKPIHQIHKEIQEISRLLDLFEAQMALEEKRT